MTVSYVKIAGLLLILILAVLLPILIGQYYGIFRHKRSPERKETPIGSVVGAALGLLGFMLALTFQMASNRFTERKEKLLEEVTNLRTAYLRAGLLPEPYRSNTKKHIIEYVDLALELSRDNSKLNQALSHSQQILDSLWSYTEALAQQDRSSEVYALYTSSINDFVDSHHQRITLALEYRLPVTILAILFIVEFLSMLAFGYHAGITGKVSFKINLLLATTFAIVMFLIFTLDRPEIGLTPISQKPMHSLQRELHGKQSGVHP